MAVGFPRTSCSSPGSGAEWKVRAPPAVVWPREDDDVKGEKGVEGVQESDEDEQS